MIWGISSRPGGDPHVSPPTPPTSCRRLPDRRFGGRGLFLVQRVRLAAESRDDDAARHAVAGRTRQGRSRQARARPRRARRRGGAGRRRSRGRTRRSRARRAYRPRGRRPRVGLAAPRSSPPRRPRPNRCSSTTAST
ncbi:hypothetical protein ACU686_41900 [Yinghuangia aomiensis]